MSADETAATPNGTVVVARRPEGSEVNVTAGVQALYDLVISSMDWGSGFWTVEDALPVVEVADVCGFAEAAEARRYVDAQRHSEEQQRFLATVRRPIYHGGPPDHDHVWSSVGRCLWPRCSEVESDHPPEQVP